MTSDELGYKTGNSILLLELLLMCFSMDVTQATHGYILLMCSRYKPEDDAEQTQLIKLGARGVFWYAIPAT